MPRPTDEYIEFTEEQWRKMKDSPLFDGIRWGMGPGTFASSAGKSLLFTGTEQAKQALKVYREKFPHIATISYDMTVEEAMERIRLLSEQAASGLDETGRE